MCMYKYFHFTQVCSYMIAMWLLTYHMYCLRMEPSTYLKACHLFCMRIEEWSIILFLLYIYSSSMFRIYLKMIFINSYSLSNLCRFWLDILACEYWRLLGRLCITMVVQLSISYTSNKAIITYICDQSLDNLLSAHKWSN